MALAPGTGLGVYQISAPLGEGGMGQVWRALDTKLDRDVALKVLPDSFAHDAERLARFTREAKTLAALNHPHIAAIYGLEESNGITALVMELVEGEDLSQRIARGAIPLDEALPLAKQIAEALEAAHEQGDLRSITTTPGDTSKLLVPQPEAGTLWPVGWGPSGEVLFVQRLPDGKSELRALDASGTTRTVQPGAEDASLSPDGSWLAYVSAQGLDQPNTSVKSAGRSASSFGDVRRISRLLTRRSRAKSARPRRTGEC